MQIISMAWGAEYLRAASSLLGSARRFSLPLTTIEISGEPSSPQEAKRLKPTFIKKWLKKGPVTWIDADAYIHKYPKILFQEIECDIACYYPRAFELWNGTLLFNPTPVSFKILDLWEEALEKDFELDQVVLSNIIKEISPSLYNLPYNYCWMRDVHQTLGSPIIEQYGIGFYNQI